MVFLSNRIWGTLRCLFVLSFGFGLRAQIVYIDGGSILVNVNGVYERIKVSSGSRPSPSGPLVNISEGYPDQQEGGGDPEEGEIIGHWYFVDWAGPWENRRDWSKLAVQTAVENFSYTEPLAGKVTLTGSVSSSVTSKLTLGEVVAASSEQQFQTSYTAAQEVSYTVKPRYRAILQLWAEMWTRPFTEELRISQIPVMRETGQAYQGRSSTFKFADGPI